MAPSALAEFSMDNSTQPWQANNFDYLMQAIAIVRGYLTRHIANRQAQPYEEDLETAIQTQATTANTMSAPPALEVLCQKFGLSEFERAILLCCTGQAMHPDFPGVLAIAQNIPELGSTTFQLALQCFPNPHWNSVTARRPLRQWQLVRWASTPEPPRAPLQIDEAILNYLVGEPYSDPFLEGTVTTGYSRASSQIQLQPSHQTIVEQMVGLFYATSELPPVVQLCGTLRDFQQAITTQVSQAIGVPLYSLSSDSIPRDRAELQHLMLRLRRWFVLEPALLQVQITNSKTSETGPNGGAPLVDVFLNSINLPLIVLTDQRLQLSHPAVLTFDVVGLQYGEQLELWQDAWEEADAPASFQDEELARLASQFRLSGAMIQTASAAVQNQVTESTTELGTRLWEFCRLQARPQLEGLAQRITVNATWDDLILPEREKNTLRQITTHVRQQARVYQQWGFAGKNQRGLGLAALFAGASGTGKTTAAEILANELKLDLFRIDLSAIMSKYIGETEKNLRRIFDAAEVGGAILLFDEADALFGKRTQVKDSHDRHANIEVSYLLQRMESYQGLAILTTNLKDNLDQAFLRRLRFILNFPYPKQPERSKIWQRVFPKQTPTQDLDFELLGQLDVTGGNIKAIALNAAFLAAEAEQPVTMKLILDATKTEYLKLGRMLTSQETQYWDVG
ncbi:MAG: ATP-binding protein [Spirulina sp. SIO3F2]|nr:ATP-binding protein [Spirulina sp. SIO3F2]